MINSKMSPEELPDWFVDLLILRATDGLDENQQHQFDEFVKEHPDRNRIDLEAERYELVVAAIDLNFQNKHSRRSEGLPGGMRNRLLDSANVYFADPPADNELPKVEKQQKTGLTSREAFAWLAAAAAVILMLTGLNPFAPENGPDGDGRSDRSVAEQYAEFVADDQGDLVHLDWSATDAGAGATGKVAWRDSEQKGFMVFRGLRANNPAKSQYQLWIFDTDTGQKHPVDGGVFDVVAGKENIIPIDPRIPVSKAVQFAITEEKPGGVVVSDRSRLPLLAVVD